MQTPNSHQDSQFCAIAQQLTRLILHNHVRGDISQLRRVCPNLHVLHTSGYGWKEGDIPEIPLFVQLIELDIHVALKDVSSDITHFMSKAAFAQLARNAEQLQIFRFRSSDDFPSKHFMKSLNGFEHLKVSCKIFWERNGRLMYRKCEESAWMWV